MLGSRHHPVSSSFRGSGSAGMVDLASCWWTTPVALDATTWSPAKGAPGGPYERHSHGFPSVLSNEQLLPAAHTLEAAGPLRSPAAFSMIAPQQNCGRWTATEMSA
jgi:hypothetical protein